MYAIFTADLPVAGETMTATYGHDIALLSSHENSNIAFIELQNHINQFERWLKC